MIIRDECSTIQSTVMDVARDIENMEYMAKCSEQTAALVIIAAELRKLNEELRRGKSC